MKKLLIMGILLFTSLSHWAQESKNVVMLSHVPMGEDASDIWGYTDGNGLEYAIIGVRSGIKIFSLEDPLSPKLIEHIKADNSIWRDIKSFGNKLYSVADQGNDGILVINMQDAPHSITWHFVNPIIDFENLKGEIKTCHNLFIDSLGFLYLAGCNIGNQGVIISQIANDSSAINPLGNTNAFYTHDVYVNGNLMYSSDVLAGQLSIYNISDKTKPLLESSIQTGNNFTHNAWASNDNGYVFTTDEVEGAYVEAYNIENLDNIQFLDRIHSNRINSQNVIIHNVHYYNNYLITSHYTEGVTIVDAHDPENLVEIGYFDPFDNEENLSGKWFDGCWGAFPFYKSEIIAISDISNGLYILKPDYIKASRISGTVKDVNSLLPVRNASIDILSREDLTNYTDLNGAFKTGSTIDGFETLIIDHPLYDRQEVMLELNRGNTLNIDILMSSVSLQINVLNRNNTPEFDMKLRIIDNSSNNAILIENIDGTMNTPLSRNKTYTLIFAKWGKQEKIIENFHLDENSTIDVVMSTGYEDSFVFDNDWKNESFASSGSWQRGTPIAKTYGGKLLQPNFDSPFDIGSDCYFTNLSGGGSNSGDVDNGFVVLKSPLMSLKPNSNYDLSFDYWFSNERGSVPPNDSLTIMLKSANKTIHLATITTSGQNWRNFNGQITISKDEILSDYYLEIIAFDKTPDDHVVEAGIDNIKILESSTVSVDNNVSEVKVEIYPNPVKNIINLKSDLLHRYTLQIYDPGGRLLLKNNNLYQFTQINVNNYKPGIYILKLVDKENASTIVSRFIKI